MSDEPYRADKLVMSVDDQCRMFARMLVEMTDRLHHQDRRIAELMARIAAVENLAGIRIGHMAGGAAADTAHVGR
jgi:hypothetical protein